MQDGARFFAYATWTMMISLAIIMFTNRFLEFALEPGWVGILILLGFGFIYFNLTYAAVKRYIRKVPAPTNSHMGLAFIIYLPPALWVIFFIERYGNYSIVILLIVALGCIIGTITGNRAGIKARYEYVQKLKEQLKKAESQKSS